MKLSRLRHLLLSTMCNDIEPLHALQSDASREIQGVSVEEVVDGLLSLCQLGLVKPYFFDEATGKYDPLAKLTKGDILKHCAGRTLEELVKWPGEASDGEYFFEITKKGRKEEARETYAEYYSDTRVLDR